MGFIYCLVKLAEVVYSKVLFVFTEALREVEGKAA